MSCRIVSVSGVLPDTLVSNNDLAKYVDTSNEWVLDRTGIEQRYFAHDVSLADMAVSAAKKCIESCDFDMHSIDMVIVSTCTNVEPFPSISARIHGMLGLKMTCGAIDLSAACSGFVHGMHVARAMISSGMHRNILLVCADKMSEIVDFSKRNTAVLFGDAASAVLITRDDANLYDTMIYSDGQKGGVLSSNIRSQTIDMEGQAVYRNAILNMTSATQELLKKNGLTVDDIDLVIPHQANIHIIHAVADRLNISRDKLVVTVNKHANTSAASIPLALSDYASNHDMHNKTCLFTAIGGGLVWGSAVTRM